MAKYRPGTCDDLAVTRRRREAMGEGIASASVPSGSRTYQSTDKLKELERAVTPVHGAVLMAVDESPAESGCPGTWERLTAFHVPMTDVTLYIYERTE